MNSFLSLPCFFLFFCFAGCYEQRDDVKTLEEVVLAFNKTCPRLLDSETKIEGIEIKGKNTVVYKYTLIHVLAVKVDTVEFKRALWPGILSMIKISPDLNTLKNQQTTFEYAYSDRLHKPVYTFKVYPKDYLPKL